MNYLLNLQSILAAADKSLAPLLVGIVGIVLFILGLGQAFQKDGDTGAAFGLLLIGAVLGFFGIAIELGY